MKKRLLSLLLAMLLIFGNALTAMAGARVPTKLEKLAYTSDDMVWREYTSTKSSYNVSMKAGERIEIPSLHWVDTNYASYDVHSISSSNPEVVEAGSYLPGQEQYGIQINEMNGDRQYMGIVLHAKSAGTATVTVSYRVYLTKLGLNYRDKRDTDTYTKTFYVTVSDASMKVSLKTTAAEDWFKAQAQGGVNMTRKEGGRGSGRSIKGVMVKMDKIIHKMAGELKMPVNKLNDILAWLALAEGASGFPIRELYEMYFDPSVLISYYMKVADEYRKGEVMDAVTEGIGSVSPALGSALKAKGHKMLGGLFKLIELADPDSAYYETVEMMSLNIPRCDPAYVYLEVTMENDGTEPLTNIRGNVVPNEHISFVSGSSGQGEETDFELPGVTLAPGEKKTYGIRFFVDLTNVTMEKRKGTFDVECSYYAPNSDVKGTAGAQTSISIYSMMTSEQIDLYKEQKSNPKHAGFYNKFYAVRESGFQRTYIACPVEVLVQDTDGNELAVIRTGDEEEYRSDGITVGAYDDMKYISLDPEFANSYKVLIRAEEDGEMGVLAGRETEDTGIGVNLYGEIPLKKGEMFYFDFSGDSAGTLYKETAAGTGEKLEPTFALNEDTVLESLAESDISQWAVEPVKEGILRGITGDIMEENYQKEISLEEFCSMLLGIYEEAVGIISGEKAAEFHQAYEDQDISASVGAAVSLGFLPEEYLDYVFAPDPAQCLISREEAALAMLNCLTLLEMDTLSSGLQKSKEASEDAPEETGDEAPEAENEEEDSDETTETTSEAAAMNGTERIQTLRRLGIMCAEGGEPSPERMLTREESISALYEMRLYMRMIVERSELIESSFRNIQEKMTTYDLSELMRYGIQYRAVPEQMDDSAMQTFSFYLPTVDQFYGIDGALILMNFAEILTQEYIGNLGHTEAPVPVDTSRVQKESLRVCSFVADSRNETDDSFYLWAPLYFEDDNGGIQDDKVYLLIDAGKESADTELVETHGGEYLGNGREELMIVADQEIVQEYLELSRPLIERYEPSLNTESYTELAQGNQGDNVRSLQKMLNQLGYREGALDGIYGSVTASAVSAFQEAMGLEVTGVADPETQAVLYSQNNPGKLLLTWLDSRG